VLTGLSYLAAGHESEIVAVESADRVGSARMVAVARELARHRPVVVLAAPGRGSDWWDQVGANSVDGVEPLAGRVRELLAARRGGAWEPPARGALVELPGCDVSRAREVLDQAGSPVVDLGPTHLLGAGPTRQLMAAYGIPTGPLAKFAAPGGAVLTIQGQGGIGLVAHSAVSLEGGDGGLTRLLPLSERDAAELVAAAPGSSGSVVVADALLRAARLIDDQADVSRVRVGPGGVAIWTGPVRGTEDDPFVRRLRGGL
jgi:hypothetical protein